MLFVDPIEQSGDSGNRPSLQAVTVAVGMTEMRARRNKNPNGARMARAYASNRIRYQNNRFVGYRAIMLLAVRLYAFGQRPYGGGALSWVKRRAVSGFLSSRSMVTGWLS